MPPRRLAGAPGASRLRPLLRALSRLGLALALLGAIFAAGAARLELRLAVAALVLSAVCIRSLGDLRVGLRLPAALWPFAAVAALIALQLVPLPAALIEALSPATGALHAQLGQLDPQLIARDRPLNLDPSSGAVALWDQLAFLGVLFLGLNLRRGRQGVALQLLFALSVGAVVVAVAHWILQPATLYGLYRPSHSLSRPVLSAPFINPNHLAGLLVLSLGAALGWIAHSAHRAPSRLATTALVAALIALPLTGSRSGVAAGLLTVALFWAVFWLRRRRVGADRLWRHTRAARGLTAVLAGLSLLAFVALQWRSGRLWAVHTDQRFDLWPAAWRQAQAHWLVGTGRGSFVYSYPQVQSQPIFGTVTHPENHLLQLASELGLPGALLALGGGLWLWWALRPRLRDLDPTALGLWAGLFGLGAQQLVDFGLEIPGVALPCALALGLLWARSPQLRAVTPRRALPLALVSAALCAALLWSAAPLSAQGPMRRLRPLLEATDVEALHQRALAQIDAHPADGQIALLAADRLINEATQPPRQALRWLNFALSAQPQDARAHWLLAQYFVKRGHPQQAAGAFRRALERAPWQRNFWLPVIAQSLSEPTQLAAAIPEEDDQMAGQLIRLVLAQDAPRALALIAQLESLQLQRALLTEREVEPAPTEWRILRAQAHLQGEAWPAAAEEIAQLRAAGEAIAWVLWAQLSVEAPEAAQVAAQTFGGSPPVAAQTADPQAEAPAQAEAPEAPEAAQVAAQTPDGSPPVAAQSPERALDRVQGILQSAPEAAQRDPAFQRAAARLYLQLGDLERAQESAQRLWRLVGHRPPEAARALALLARIEERRERPERALQLWLEAAKLDERADYLRAAAQQAQRTGDLKRAQRLRERAQRLQGLTAP